ncbi:MAG: hypothetical protein ABW098_02145 [Candidatus Thiodiazotropha sp.]
MGGWQLKGGRKTRSGWSALSLTALAGGGSRTGRGSAAPCQPPAGVGGPPSGPRSHERDYYAPGPQSQAQRAARGHNAALCDLGPAPLPLEGMHRGDPSQATGSPYAPTCQAAA